MFSAIDQSGKMPSFCRSPATSATGAATSAPPARSKTWTRNSVCPCPVSPPRPTTSPAWATSSPASARPRGRARTTGGASGARGDRPRPPRRAGADAAHRADQRRRGRRPRRASSATTRASRITAIRSAVERISPRRCEIRITLPPAAVNRRTCASSWPREHAVERRGRLVEDHHLGRRVGDGEGAGDLDHLPPGDREAADLGARVRCRGRKDRVEHLAHQRRRAAAASPSRRSPGA